MTLLTLKIFLVRIYASRYRCYLFPFLYSHLCLLTSLNDKVPIPDVRPFELCPSATFRLDPIIVVPPSRIIWKTV